MPRKKKSKQGLTRKDRFLVYRNSKRFMKLCEDLGDGNLLILGIDYSLNAPGICVTDRYNQIVYSVQVEQDKKKSREARLENLRDEVERVMLLYKPSLFCYESVNAGSHFQSVVTLSNAYGACVDLLCENQDYYNLAINIGQIKKFAAGNGKADKIQVINGLNEIRGRDLGLTDDEADAYAATLIYSYLLEFCAGITSVTEEEYIKTGYIHPLTMDIMNQKQLEVIEAILSNVDLFRWYDVDWYKTLKKEYKNFS